MLGWLFGLGSVVNAAEAMRSDDPSHVLAKRIVSDMASEPDGWFVSGYITGYQAKCGSVVVDVECPIYSWEHMTARISRDTVATKYVGSDARMLWDSVARLRERSNRKAAESILDGLG